VPRVRVRAIRRDHVVIAFVAVTLALCLIAINVLFPAAFGVFIAIGGAIGALMVVYEVRLTKRLAQAEFIRDLQTSFSADANICELWRKLLLEEEITPADRARVSSYLTFFETLHLLVDRGALDLALTDDLFRNRFFKAVGNHGVLETALVKDPGSFANIHDLIATWHDYLLANGIPMHPGYYGYVAGLARAKGYEVGRLGEPDLVDLERLQEEVHGSLTDGSWLRVNSDVMLKECLVDHVTLGARFEGELVAAAVLYDGGESEENIQRYLSDDPDRLRQSINLKVVLVAPGHRRKGLSRTLVELLEQQAHDLGRTEILCTIHPQNAPSEALFRMLGYDRRATVSSAYGSRNVFGRELPAPDKRWAR